MPWLFLALCMLVSRLTVCLSVKIIPTLPNYLSPGVSSQQFNLSLSVRIDGAGFHRTLSVAASTNLQRVTNITDLAPIRFLLHITRDVYVDVDQLNALEALGGPQMTVSAHMDTEQAATCSSDHWLLVSGIMNLPVSLPLHLRYQAPSTQPYKTIYLTYPQLFVQWNTEVGCDIMHNNQSRSDTMEEWSWVGVPTGQDALQLDIPCGLTYHIMLVVPVTIAITLVGAVYLIITIRHVHTYNCM